MKHLKTHYSEISDDDNFMRFRYNAVKYNIWYNWANLSLIITCVRVPMQFVFNLYKCKNFDVWYSDFKNNAEPIGWKVLDTVISVLTLVLLLNTMMSAITMNIIRCCCYRKQIKAEEAEDGTKVSI